MEFDGMSTEQIEQLILDAQGVLEVRGRVSAARATVEAAVDEFAAAAGCTVLQAWRALAPEEVAVPDDPVPEPVPDAPEYVQPQGAHDAYRVGDLVTFEGRVYRAVMDAVVWSPLAYPQAWREVE